MCFKRYVWSVFIPFFFLFKRVGQIVFRISRPSTLVESHVFYRLLNFVSVSAVLKLTYLVGWLRVFV